jgi:hypothetical protein
VFHLVKQLHLYILYKEKNTTLSVFAEKTKVTVASCICPTDAA